MLAILYLLVCLFWGMSFVILMIPDIRRLFTAISPSKSIVSDVPDLLFTIPSGMIIGMMSVGMFNYFSISILSRFISGNELCKKVGILMTLAVFIVLGTLNTGLCLKRKPDKKSPLPQYERKTPTVLIYGITTVVTTMLASFIMFYAYKSEGNVLMAGWSTFSDLSPHTAMVSSFGVGFNFPTQYMHFSGDGIQYHFLFYFFCGMLQYLGLPIDWAINLPSIICMVCTMTLAGLLAVIFSRRRIAFIFTPVLIFFRSSLNFWYQLQEQFDAGKDLSGALKAIGENTAWYGKTPFDTWGIWAVNVYANQRHLMLGMACILILIILTAPFIRRMCNSILNAFRNNTAADGLKSSAKTFFLSREAWLWRKEDPLNPLGIMILSSILVIIMPYHHGSALIGGLLVLALMAVFSESRLVYLAIAVSAVTSSVIQTKLFSGGSEKLVKFQHITGFVAEDKSAKGVMTYIITVTGLTLITAVIYAVVLLVRDIIKKKPVYRSILFICFLVPLIFAFNYQVSFEMLANHKFIQFTLILADIFVAGALSELFCLPLKNKKAVSKKILIPVQSLTAVIASVMLIPLLATGIFEWCTFYSLNKNHLDARLDSEMVEWIEENTSTEDVFLTPPWSFNRFFLAGRPAYFGHPYYAMSAGHDTYRRDEIYYWLLTGCNNDYDEFVRYCKERHIRYIVEDPELYYTVNSVTGQSYNYEFVHKYLTPVAYFHNDNMTAIYKIY